LEEKVARFENMEAELVKLQLENQVCINFITCVCIYKSKGVEKEIGAMV